MHPYNKPNDLAYRAVSRQGPLIAVVNVQISKSLSDKIQIHQYDNDEDLAHQFISKHKLPQKAFAILLRQITSSRESVLRENPVPKNIWTVSNPSPQHNKPQKHQQPTHRTQLTQAESRMKLMTQRTEIDPDTQKMSLFTKKEESAVSSVSPSRMSRSRSTQVITSRLYNEATVKQDYLRRLQARAEKKIPEEELVEMTYRPKINEISEELAKKNRGEVPIEERLFREGAKLEEKRERSRSQHLRAQQFQCSFKPELNPITKKLSQNRSGTKSRRQIQFQQPTFHPEVNRMSMLIMQHRGDFLQRSRQFQQSKMMKIKQMYGQLKKKQILDLNTGKPLYQPHLISQTFERSRGKKSIGEYLYELSKDKKPQVKHKQSLQINRNSAAILKGMQTRRVAWLFSEMDSDQDGRISASRCSIDRIPESILEIIMPILFEMEDFNFELTVEDFQQAIQSLNKSLTSEQKSILYDYKRKNTYDPYEGVTFKPDLNK